MKPKTLVVLAGGFGTRLRSVVSEVPKPLAPVAGRPYLHYLIEQWLEQGVDRLIFLLHHQAELIKDSLALAYKEGGFGGCELTTLTEPVPMGTGGALAYAVQQLDLKGEFLVANADTWLGSGIRQLFETKDPALGVVQVRNSERYGSVRIQGDRITAFDEKQNSSGPGWINAGLYNLGAALFQDWDGSPFSLEQALFPKLVGAGRLTAVPLEADFIDIGIPEDYARFCRWIESEKAGAL